MLVHDGVGSGHENYRWHETILLSYRTYFDRLQWITEQIRMHWNHFFLYLRKGETDLLIQ